MPCILNPFDPAELTPEEFLMGPDRNPDVELIIDSIFAKSFGRIYREQRAFDPSSLEITDNAHWSHSLIDRALRFVDVEAGLLLIASDGQPCGGYIGCDVSIRSEHHGYGLGAELILEYAMRHACLPTWDLGKVAYSENGHRAHLNAHRMAEDRAFFDRKCQALKHTAPAHQAGSENRDAIAA